MEQRVRSKRIQGVIFLIVSVITTVLAVVTFEMYRRWNAAAELSRMPSVKT